MSATSRTKPHRKTYFPRADAGISLSKTRFPMADAVAARVRRIPKVRRAALEPGFPGGLEAGGIIDRAVARRQRRDEIRGRSRAPLTEPQIVAKVKEGYGINRQSTIGRRLLLPAPGQARSVIVRLRSPSWPRGNRSRRPRACTFRLAIHPASRCGTPFWRRRSAQSSGWIRQRPVHPGRSNGPSASPLVPRPAVAIDA